jgi:rhodanese-related sulfurtransferase
MLTPLSPADVRDMLAKGARLIDLRAPDEFAAEHIEGSENLPLPNVPKIEGGQPVIFSCLSGARVAANAEMLAEAAGGAAYALEGSLNGWKRAGLPTVAGDRKPGFLGGLFGKS